ncbi:MAG: methyltransferase domain-containing protein, partial [Methyloprofundus sp.]|nr:methyltransferase domain-containing protein [Methyloprofundus sp.]
MAALILDKQQIRQSFANASQSYDAMASLQRKVGRELLTKVSLTPDALVLDIGCGTGFFTEQLKERALLKNIIALDIALPMLLKTQQRLADNRVALVCADAEQLPFATQSMDGLVSNLALQWCLGIEELFADVQRILRKEGQFVFSTFGSSALCELKAAWAEVDDSPHVNEFCHLETLQQKLIAAGFSNIQLESKTYQRKYANVIELMRELKG